VLRSFVNLKIIGLSSLKISDITAIGNLTNLTDIHIGGTDVHDISILENMVHLQNLSANSTKIKDLGPLKKLKTLKFLMLDDTQVNDLSPLVDSFNLEVLFIRNTQIFDLSPVSDLEKLKELFFENSPIKNPPIAIINKDIDSIRRYFKELNTKETQTNNQTKLIFIGNSRAGKTSLWQFLKDKIYTEYADSTHGIKTEIWDSETLGTEDNQNLAAHIWDFGGQEYYHATHRLFLADNAVYVLVWEKDSNSQGTRLEQFKLDDDPNGEIEEVELEHFSASYWWENIQYFAGEHCPVLIVQNKVDSKSDFSTYTEGVSETADCFHLSIKNAFERYNLGKIDHDFEKFKETLLELLRKNATAFKLVKYYAQVRESLETKAKNTEYIAVSELKDIALQFDETPDLENLLAYLKSFTNTVLYFPQNDMLRDRLYLNPTHISRDIYKILNKTVRENNGKFDMTHIQKRLNCDVSESERFVALMKEFDLVFEKEEADKGQVFIAPQYLKEKDKLGVNIAMFSKQLKLKPAFYIHFAIFVPRSMMSRFIAHNGQFTTDETYWKNGLIYGSKETDAPIKVEYTPETRTFCIDVQNIEQQVVDMQNIVAQFVKLNGNSEDKIELSNDGQAYFELRKIQEAHHQNRIEMNNIEGQYTPLSSFNWLIKKHKTRASMTLKQLKEKVRELISKARIKEAMDEVAAWAHEQNQEQLKSDISLLKGDWTDLSREITLGLLSSSDATLRQNKLMNKVLNLVDSLEGEGKANGERPLNEQQASGKRKILMLTANPTNQARLRLDSEHSNILEELQEKQEQFIFTIKKGVSKSEFQKLTVKANPEILHFSGHGESSEYGTGGLVLQDTDGKEDVVPAKGLSLLFRFFRSENIAIKAAILNACYSEEQAQAICEHVPYVIGTTLNIGDTAAIAFSTGFYYKLAENGTIEQAFNAGITRAAMDGADETYFALYKDGQKEPISF
jgi:internalin A